MSIWSNAMVPASEEARSCISIDCEEDEIKFVQISGWFLFTFLPERTAALAVDGKGGNFPALLQAFLATDL